MCAWPLYLLDVNCFVLDAVILNMRSAKVGRECLLENNVKKKDRSKTNKIMKMFSRYSKIA